MTRKGWSTAQPESRSTATRTDAELERIVDRRAAVPELEVAQLLGAVGSHDREIDPSADAQLAAWRHARRVETVVLVAHRPVAERLHVPVPRLREDRLLLGLEVAPSFGEVGEHGRAWLGVGGAGRGEERVAHP